MFDRDAAFRLPTSKLPGSASAANSTSCGWPARSGNGGRCVEVARGGPDVVVVRDSKDPGGPKLAFTPAEWKAFTRTVKG